MEFQQEFLLIAVYPDVLKEVFGWPEWKRGAREIQGIPVFVRHYFDDILIVDPVLVSHF